jgi:hypothetical protein
MSQGGLARLALLTATSRAKSDVANKAVSMFLHELSKRICADFNVRVAKPAYADVVEELFGSNCPYCGEPLKPDRLAVEHLDGMNRVRLGLHIPGNVAVACTRCNREKRRDDQAAIGRTLAPSGWESFLSHSGERCDPKCKTCRYWAEKWPDPMIRRQRLQESLERIKAFRARFSELLLRVETVRVVVRKDVESLYRECQDFATDRIDRMTGEVIAALCDASPSD